MRLLAVGFPRHDFRGRLHWRGIRPVPFSVTTTPDRMKVLNIILPNIQCAMSGVWRIQRVHELVVLNYTDGSTEAADVPLTKWAEIHQEPFRIISEVQSKRKHVASNT